MSPGRHDKIEVGRIDKGGFEDEETAENTENVDTVEHHDE